MYNIIFYIFFCIITLSLLHIAFSKSLINSFFSFILILFSASGIFTMLHFELFALIIMLLTSFTFAVILLFKPEITDSLESDFIHDKPVRIITIGTIALTSSVISSIVSSTRWQLQEINYEINNYGLWQTKYLPIIIICIVTFSVIISSINYVFKNDTGS